MENVCRKLASRVVGMDTDGELTPDQLKTVTTADIEAAVAEAQK